MHNPLKRFIEFIKTPGHSRTISVVVILIIAAAVPLTVLVAQQQQQTQQHASFLIPCNPRKNTCNRGDTTSCRCGGGIQCVRVNISQGACYMWVGSCNACPTANKTPTPAPVINPCTHKINGVYVKGGYCPSPYGGKYLYNCLNGKTVSKTTCTKGCRYNAGTYDTCK